MSTPSLTSRRRLTRLRLRAQRIAASDCTTPKDVVGWMLAMQAQDFMGAKWSVGLRIPRSTDADIERALASGSIVRSWPMRGTLHFVAAADLRWMLAVTTPRILAGATKRHQDLALTQAQFERAREAALMALTGGGAMTREQMQDVFTSAGISPEGQRGYHLLWYLAHTGTLCFGPTRGKQQTFVLLDEWVAPTPGFQRDEALGEFARRYFTSHGPATISDFAWWASLTLTQARIGLAVARPALAELELDGTTYYLSQETLAAPSAGPIATYALPGFDEYLLGYQNRSAALAPEHAEAVVPGGNGVFMPTIVVSGAVAGTWKRTINRRDIVVEPLPFDPLNAQAATGFARAMKAYGDFLGLPIRPAD